ncbi:hypothetical protein ACP3V3_16895 [Vibrio sp. PNB22_3_1]
MKFAKNIEQHQRFGMLVAICKSTQKDAAGAYKIECQCDCGKTKAIATSSLRSGKSRSCGCMLKQHQAVFTQMQHHYFDFNKDYGLLRPVKFAGKNRFNARYVRAICTGCGGSDLYLASNLNQGYTRTCGKHQCIKIFNERFPDAPAHPKTLARSS